MGTDRSAVIPPMTPDDAVPQDPPPPIRGMRRLMIWNVPANFVVFMIWGALPTVMLPQQLAVMNPDEKVRNFGLVSTFGAVAALIAQPLAGVISDRTRSRFGRRAPWMVLGALAGGLALIGLGLSNSLWGIGLAWVLVQTCYNFAQGPLSAIMPDRVPHTRRGTFSTLTGMGLLLGNVGGYVIGASFLNSLRLGYVIFAIVTLLVMVVFNLTNPDYSSADAQLPRFDLREFLKTFWVSPREHPDFTWAFIGRLLLYIGYYVVTGYQLYVLTDYLHVANPDTEIMILSVIMAVGLLITIVPSGPWSDRLGRRKPFVFASSMTLGIAMVIPWASPTIYAWMAMTFIGAMGFGMYQSVDTALMSEVLPNPDDYAKDLGVINIAATFPQIIAPGVGSLLVTHLGYAALFPCGIIFSVLGAVSVFRIKSVR